MQTPGQDIAGEGFGLHVGQGTVKGQDHDAGHAGFGQQGHFLGLAGDLRRFGRIAEKMAGMGEKSQNYRHKAALAGNTQQLVEQPAVADVHAVEIAHSHSTACKGQFRR